jgi:hypothetical protein
MDAANDKTTEADAIEATARADYERCHPDDTFDDLKRRARFSKEDRGLLDDWLSAARALHGEAAHPGEKFGPE